MQKCLLIGLLSTLPTGIVHAEPTGEIPPFTTDGCSVFPDGSYEDNELWLDCCTAHDLAYWRGGTYSERVAADEALQVCVAAVGEPEIAALMLAGVRVGGSPYFPTTFRWGYGWDGIRPYGELSLEELEQIKQKLVEAKMRESQPEAPALKNSGFGTDM